MNARIDLNSDIGEGYGAYTLGDDEAVMAGVSSINVACGWHAGDPRIMETTVRRAKTLGLGIGAHPGYPDLLGLGRRELSVSSSEARAYVLYQVGALAGFAAACGGRLQHVKLHGAFYNKASVDRELAAATAMAIRDLDRELIVLALAGSELARACKELGLRVVEEAFADRAYESDGSLVGRSASGALLHDAEEVAARAVRMATTGSVVSIDGVEIAVNAGSICVHGDTPEAVAHIEAIRGAFRAAKIDVVPLRELA